MHFRQVVHEALKRNIDIMVTIDADGQFNPADIPQIIEPIINNSADCVTASRFFNKDLTPHNMGKIKIWGNKKVANMISWLTGQIFYDVSCGFRAYNKEALLNLNLFGNFTYTQETFLDLCIKGLRIKEVPIKVEYFSDRKSRVANNLIKYAFNILNIIMGSILYHKSFKFFAIPGIIFIITGTLFEIFLFLNKLITGAFTPFKIFGFIGGGLFMFGVLILIASLFINLIDRLKTNQEKMLYYLKKNQDKN